MRLCLGHKNVVDFPLKVTKKQKIVLQTPFGYGKILVNLKLYDCDDSFSNDKQEDGFFKASNFLSQNTDTFFIRKEKQILRQEREWEMVNVRDAANYLLRLYYYGNRNCTSAVIQKLLIVAQFKHLYLYDTPLFEDDLFVKPSCFSIKIISNTYPDIIFDEETRIGLVDMFQSGDIVDVPDTNCATLPKLASFYDIFSELNQQEMDIINQTYIYFGKFSGKCIGEFMRNLEVHKNKTVFTNVTVQEIQEYIRQIPATDTSNEIIKFILQK